MKALIILSAAYGGTWLVNIKFTPIPNASEYIIYLRDGIDVDVYKTASTEPFTILGLSDDTVYNVSYSYILNGVESLRSEETYFTLPLNVLEKPKIRVMP